MGYSMDGTNKNYTIGHETYIDKNENTFFVDNNERVKKGVKRECPCCKKICEVGKPDPCLGKLPSVDFACCGHGVETGYIAFQDGTIIYFLSPISVMKTNMTPRQREILRELINNDEAQ